MKTLVILLLLFSACVPVKTSLKQTSIDVSVDVYGGFYPTVGASVPIGPVWLSSGFWVGWDYAQWERSWGPYISLGWSWGPFVE